MSVYRVTGTLPYRGHEPGSEFEARLAPDVELRALERGNITIIDSSWTRLRPGSWTLPDGWETHQLSEPAEAGSLFERGK